MTIKQNKLIELAFELSPAGILAVDQAGRILLVNHELAALFGYEQDELKGQSIEILVPSRHHDKHPVYRENFVANPSARPMGKGVRLTGVRKDGVEIPVEVGLNPVHSEDDIITLATVVDITAREMAEERFRIAVESAPSGMLMTNARGEILMANKEIETLFAYSREALLGMTVEDLIPARFSGQHPALRQEFFQDPRTRAMGSGRELFGLRSDGVEIPLEIGLNPIDSPTGLCVLVSVVDISARMSAERQARQSQKMEAVGTLAGGIAHDFNNILLNILGHAELAKFNLSSGTTEFEDIEQIIAAAQRGKSLVERILTFSRHDTVETTAVDCVAVVQEAVQLLRATTPSFVSLREIHEDDVPQVMCNETQLHQIILNLATNAVHAMPNGGNLDISLAPWIQESHVTGNGWENGDSRSPGLYTRITVEDTGGGIEGDKLERIFEPFYTSKGPGEGSGLGLSIVHGIVESLGGRIDVTSELNKGTCFDIFLPAVPKLQADYEGAEDSKEAGRMHILAVDDEKPLARMLARQLERLGYGVSSFHSSLEALSAYKANPDKFDMLITDNTMPKMTGLDLVKQIKTMNSDLPVIFLSGHLSEEKLGELKELKDILALGKPFSMQELSAAMEKLLQQK